MKYLFAIIFPPLGFISVGKPFQAILSFLLVITLLGWPIAVIWCWLVINGAHADKRTEKLIKALKESKGE
jgi:uncharacterized membrane protein YqaE (UPF0057 family)